MNPLDLISLGLVTCGINNINPSNEKINKMNNTNILYVCILQYITNLLDTHIDADLILYFLASIPFFAVTIFAVLGGILSERIGRKKMVLVTSPLFVVGCITQGLANGMVVVNVGRFICGMAGGLIVSPGGV